MAEKTSMIRVSDEFVESLSKLQDEIEKKTGKRPSTIEATRCMASILALFPPVVKVDNNGRHDVFRF